MSFLKKLLHSPSEARKDGDEQGADQFAKTADNGATASQQRGTLPPRFSPNPPINTASSTTPNVFRDGGGGGKVNGHNIILFSDTTTTNGGIDGQMIGFATNTIAYLDPHDPAKLRDFCDGPRPKPGIPFLKEEEKFTAENFDSKGQRMVIWNESNITAINETIGIFVAPIAVFTRQITGWDMYNTLCTIEAKDDGPVVKRVVERLFSEKEGEVNWGKFGNLLNPHTGKLNFFAKDKTGLKVAQVAIEDVKDRSKWLFFNGQTYTPRQPTPDSAHGNIISDSFSTGTVFWSPYFRTFLCVYMNQFPGTFRLRYSLDGSVEGKWSDPAVMLLNTVPGKDRVPYNFAGHAYPDYDESGKTLLLGWTWEGNWMRTAKVVFE